MAPLLRLVIVLALLVGVAACGTTPSAPGKAYDVRVDFLKLAQGQCMAVSSYTNRYGEPIRISGDIRLLDGEGGLVGSVPLMTETVAPGDRQRMTHSLMQIFNDRDLARCRSIDSYQVKVSLCRTADGRYLDGTDCVGDQQGRVTW
ncbi:MAG: hypothetical protein R3298_05960 [Gammaproteobacteria bacterium]|nr:hypothetical protein [Gammaproteobacteria bacterium]